MEPSIYLYELENHHDSRVVVTALNLIPIQHINKLVPVGEYEHIVC